MLALPGHSLGGALATLAAYDLAAELGLSHVQCITFGAPRVGNSVFVADYNRHVPDTWYEHREHLCTLAVDELTGYEMHRGESSVTIPTHHQTDARRCISCDQRLLVLIQCLVIVHTRV